MRSNYLLVYVEHVLIMVTPSTTEAASINLLNSKTVPMRTFYIAWITLFLCFFGWLGLAELPFASETIAYRESLFTIGTAVTMVSFVSLALSLSKNATPDATHVGVESTTRIKNRYWKKTCLTYKPKI